MTIVRKINSLACGCDAANGTKTLVSLEQALGRIAGCVTPLQGRDCVPLADANGRILAAPILAQSDMPRFDQAAMDGYAFRHADLAGSGPWRLPVTDRVPAGAAPTDRLPPGAAARIFTGAPIPDGADVVVMQEHVDALSGAILLHHRPRLGENIRLRGEEYVRDTEIFPAGRKVTPRSIAVAASSGHGQLSVCRKIRVTILASGSEIAPPGTDGLKAAQIWDVNTPMLRACLSRPDIDLIKVETMPDDPDGITNALATAARQSDLVVTTGGVSVGEEDHLHTAMARLNGQTTFAGVAIKPGKPVTFGYIENSLWLGLPGNPQSAFVTWTLFGEAILRRMTGRIDAATRKRPAVLSHGFERKGGLCEVRVARLVGFDAMGRERVACQHAVQSGQVGALSAADGLVLLPTQPGPMPEGALVEFLPLDAQ